MTWQDITALLMEAEGIAEKVNAEGILYPKGKDKTKCEIKQEPPPRCEFCEG